MSDDSVSEKTEDRPWEVDLNSDAITKSEVKVVAPPFPDSVSPIDTVEVEEKKELDELPIVKSSDMPASPQQPAPDCTLSVVTTNHEVGGSSTSSSSEGGRKQSEEDDTKLKQSENGTLLSCGGEFGAEENNDQKNLSDSALREIQMKSDIRFFICGSCKNNPILIGCTPKLLPCLHSFCDTCLQERYEKQKKIPMGEASNQVPRLKCPSCGQEFLVAANEHPTSGFLNNQFVIESTPAHKSTSESDTHQCTSCDDESDATSYCMNCNEWLCEACVSAHLRVKMTKDHIIQKKNRNSPTPPMVDPEVVAKNIAKEKPLFCKVHPHEQLKLFCANCDKLTCRDCQLVEHKDHRYQFIDEAATKHREILKKLLQYLQINLGLLKETIVDVEKVNDGLQFQQKGMEAEINKSFNSLIEAINGRKNQLLKELKHLLAGKQALLSKQKKDLTQMRIILEHNHDFAEFAVKGGSNVALLYSRKVLGTRLHNLNSLKYRQRPLALQDLKFSMDVDKLCSYFNKIGAVFSHEDLQRKIDHLHAKTPSGNTPRTMVLASRISNKAQTPIEAMAAVSKRISDNTAVTSSGAYINLAKSGSLGLPGHQTIRGTSSLPKSYSSYKHHPLRHSSTSGGQEMMVLSSSNSKQNDHSKRDNATSYYQQQSSNQQRHSSNYGSHGSYYHHRQNSPRTIERPKHCTVSSEHDSGWSKYDYQRQNSNKSSTIDQLRKMVEGSSSSSPTFSAHDTVITTKQTPRSSPAATNMMTENKVSIKEEHISPGGSFVDSSPARPQGRNSAFDDGQNEDYCGVCRNGGQLLCCDTCPKVYHLACHVPQLTDLPSDSWSCGLCVDIGQESKAGQKRRHSDQMTEWEHKLCEKIILSLFAHVDSIPFHHKVSKALAPDYYKVITKPMDLMTVLTKLNPNHFETYKILEDFIKDIRLIFSNCFIYNSAESEVCKMGRRIEAHFDMLMKKHAPDINVYPDNGPEIKRSKEDFA